MYTGGDDVIFLTSLEAIHTCHPEAGSAEERRGREEHREEGWMDKARKGGRDS